MYRPLLPKYTLTLHTTTPSDKYISSFAEEVLKYIEAEQRSDDMELDNVLFHDSPFVNTETSGIVVVNGKPVRGKVSANYPPFIGSVTVKFRTDMDIDLFNNVMSSSIQFFKSYNIKFLGFDLVKHELSSTLKMSDKRYEIDDDDV